jgi:hypothetical protein
VDKVEGNNVTVVRQNGTDEVMPVEDFNNLRATKSEDITNKSLVGNATEAKEYFQMASEIRESTRGPKFPEEQEGEEKKERFEMEEKIAQYLSDNSSSLTDTSEAVKNLISTFKISEKKALEFVKKLREKKVAEVENIRENYAQDALQYGQKLAEANRLVLKIQKEVTKYAGIEERLVEAQQLLEQKGKEILRLQETGLLQEQTVSQLTTEVNQANAQLVEMKEVDNFKISALHTSENKVKKLEEKVRELQKNSSLDITHINESEKQIKSLEESIKGLKEAHRKDLIRLYVDSKVSALGLKLPAQTISILEGCKSASEVTTQLRQIQENLRNNIVNSSPNLNEIKIESTVQKSPVQQNIDRNVETMLKNFGV